jgi:hypothetical protein
MAAPGILLPGTKKAKVLAIARQAFGVRSFSFEALAVECWKRHPRDFSLKGFDLPDVRKVAVCVMGRKGLVSLGVMQQWEHTKRYQCI